MTRWKPAPAIAVLAALAAAPAAQAHATVVGAYENYFKPRKVTISLGDKVRWENQMGTHSVLMKTGGQDISSVISGDATVTSKRFEETGTFRYICRYHVEEGMKGKVIVE